MHVNGRKRRETRVNSYRCRVGLTVIGSGYALRTLAPQPGALLRGLRCPHVWVANVGPDAAAGTIAGALLWLIALWLAFGMVVTLLALAPGRIGLLASAVASRVTPAVLRRVGIAAAGASIRVWLHATAAVPHIRDMLAREHGGRGRVTLVPRIDAEQDVEIALPGGYNVTPRLAQTLKSLPGVDQVEEV